MQAFGYTMDVSSFTSLAELGMDDALFFHQWPVNYLEGHGSQSTSLFYGAGSSQVGENMPLKQFISMPSPPSSITSADQFLDQFKPCQRPLAQANDHILGERKRREKITQRFIALSALLPGLKKMDKASVLGDAIKYMKQLQEKVKILEEQNRKKPMESLVVIKKHKVYGDGEFSSSLDQSPIITEKLPIVEARFCDKEVLIIIHCEKRKALLEKSLFEIQKLHLSVVNTCVMTFADSTLNITVLAQKDEEFTINMQMELVKNLQSALEKFV